MITHLKLVNFVEKIYQEKYEKKKIFINFIYEIKFHDNTIIFKKYIASKICTCSYDFLI